MACLVASPNVKRSLSNCGLLHSTVVELDRAENLIVDTESRCKINDFGTVCLAISPGVDGPLRDYSVLR